MPIFLLLIVLQFIPLLSSHLFCLTNNWNMVSTTVCLNNEKLVKKLRNSKKMFRDLVWKILWVLQSLMALGKGSSTVEVGMTEWKGSPHGNMLEKYSTNLRLWSQETEAPKLWYFQFLYGNCWIKTENKAQTSH